ncbi:MAG: VCBS domain-containing protein, partial [Polaromonas sp.]|uniref:VCBS domain-containing protein n=1 Tax=Polaromonas sp. TaxID=1869339 RepID=UPI0027366E29
MTPTSTSASTSTSTPKTTNDVPVVAAADVTGAVTELVTATGNLTDTGTISFSDADTADTHSVTVVASGTPLGTLTASVVGGAISWSYSVAASAMEYLAKDATKVESYTLTLSDGQGGTVDRVVNVTITGTNDGPVAVADSGIAVEAGTGAGSNATGNVLTNDTDVDTADSKAVSA